MRVAVSILSICSILTFCGQVLATEHVVKLVINEADVNQPGDPESGEFVEIMNVGETTARLADYELRHLAYNWWSLVINLRLDLPDVQLQPGGRFVLCSDARAVANCDSETLFTLNDANGVLAIVTKPDGLFGEETIVDSFVYGLYYYCGFPYNCGLPDGPDGVSWLEGEIEPVTDGTNAILAPRGFGYSRACDGVDSGDSAEDFVITQTTPGGVNLTTIDATCPSCGCAEVGGEIRCCSGHGSCSRLAGRPTCECNSGWGGQLCDVPDVGCEIDSAAQCGNRGVCVEVEAGATRCDCDSGFVGPRCEHSVRHLAIRKNAPPEDFDILRIPTPTEVGGFSVCSDQEFELLETDEGCEWTGTMNVVDDGFFFALAADRASDWRVELRDPSGVRLFPGTPVSSLEDDEPGTLDVWDMPGGVAGSWSIRVHANGAPCGAVPATEGVLRLCDEDSNLALFAEPNAVGVRVGEPVGFRAMVVDDVQELLAKLEAGEMIEPTPAATRVEATGSIIQPDGSVVPLTVVVQPDGVVTGSVSSTQAGPHLVEAEVSGLTEDGSPFDFVRQLAITAVPKEIRYGHVGDETPRVNLTVHGPPDQLGSTLRFTVGVRGTGNRSVIGREYQIGAEVWGAATVDEFSCHGEPTDPDNPFDPGPEIDPDDVDDPYTDPRCVLVETRRVAEDVPIAWMGALQETQRAGGDTSGVFVPFELRVGWLSNAHVIVAGEASGRVRVTELDLRNLRIHDGKTMALLDHIPGPLRAIEDPLVSPGDPLSEVDLWLRRSRIDTAAADDLLDWKDHPEMLDGAPSDFVAALEAYWDEREVPSVVGDMVMVHGYCGAVDTWLKEDFEISGAAEVARRFVAFEGSFTGLGEDHPRGKRKGRVTSSGDFRDELTFFLSPWEDVDQVVPKAHPRAGDDVDAIDRKYLPVAILAHSQGGIATLMAYSGRESSLRADFDDAPWEVLQSAATPYGGSDLDEVLGLAGGLSAGAAAAAAPGGGALVLAINLLHRLALKAIINGAFNNCNGVKVVLDPTQTRLDLSVVPRASRERMLQTPVFRSPHCWWATNLFIPGKDDGVVRFDRARTDGVRISNTDQMCHNGGVSKADGAHAVTRRFDGATDRFCKLSVIGFLDPEYCPSQRSNDPDFSD